MKHIKPYKLFEDNSKTDFDKIIEVLSAECSEFLELLKEKNIKGLYRGATIHETPIVDGFWKMKPFERRQSRDTKSSVQKIFDDELEKAFGIRLRSKGVFASKDRSIAAEYGERLYHVSDINNSVFLFIPTNGFRYFWNPQIDDLYTELRDKWWYQKDQFYWDRGVWNEINRMCHGYQEGGIEAAKYQELTFICDSYYMLSLDYYDKFVDYLLK